jgi:hypothetical protein
MRWLWITLIVLILVGAGLLILLGRKEVGGSGRTAVGFGAGADVQLITARLYFGDPTGSGLTREDRVILVGRSLEDRIRDGLSELAAGPTAGGLASVPAQMKLRRLFLDPWGLVYLDFDRGLLGRTAPGDYEEWLAVAAIVRTVCDNFPEVREVRFMIQGQVVTSLNGYVDLEEPLDSGDFPLTAATGGL